MRKVKEFLRLKWDCGQCHCQITESCLIILSTVSDYLTRAKAAKLTWPLPLDLDEEKLDVLLFAPKGGRRSEKHPQA